MPLVELLGAAQLLVAVVGLHLQNLTMPARFLHKETDTLWACGKLKFRRRTKITRRH